MDEQIVKRCCTCKQEKEVTEFGKWTKGPDGLKKNCKVCHNAFNAASRERNPEKSKEATRNWARNNPQKAREKSRRWEAKNAEHAAKLRRDWREANRERLRELQSTRRKLIHWRLHLSIRSRIRRSLGSGALGRKLEAVLGYTKEELIRHLERQFEKGMAWENYGEWHIDHIIPLCSFKLTGPQDPDIKVAWCLSNLRPLWAQENIRKRATRTHLL